METLKQARHAAKAIESAARALKYVRSYAGQIAGSGNAGPVQHQEGTSRTESGALQIIQAEERLQESMKKYAAILTAADEIISGIPETDTAAIMRYYFMVGYSWEMVAAVMGVCTRTVQRKARKALEMLA